VGAAGAPARPGLSERRVRPARTGPFASRSSGAIVRYDELSVEISIWPFHLIDDTAGGDPVSMLTKDRLRIRLAEALEPPLAAALPGLLRMTGERIFHGHPTPGCVRLHRSHTLFGLGFSKRTFFHAPVPVF
jgi:hypothetical protein